MKLEFLKGWGVQSKSPSVEGGGASIFSGKTQLYS